MSIQDFFDNCGNGVDLIGSFQLNWSVAGVGFGQFYFYTDEDGRVHIDNECMGKAFIKQVLNMMVDDAILEDDKFRPSNLEDNISDEGC